MKLLKSIIYKLYTIALLGFVVWYGTFVYPLIFGFPDPPDPLQELALDKTLTEEERIFRRAMIEQGRTRTSDLGYDVITEQYVEGHFHRIGMTIEPDAMNVCVRCHGTVPHNRAKPLRAFLNMHAFFLACETCHVLPKDDLPPLEYRWYDKDDGRSIANPPALTSLDREKYGNYGAKIAPGYTEDGKFRFVNSERELKFVEDYLRDQDNHDSTQRSMMKRVTHRFVDEQALACNGCHMQDEPFLNYAALGYPPRRISDLRSSEVAGMIERYERFYIPRFLLRDERADAKEAEAGARF